MVKPMTETDYLRRINNHLEAIQRGQEDIARRFEDALDDLEARLSQAELALESLLPENEELDPPFDP